MHGSYWNPFPSRKTRFILFSNHLHLEMRITTGGTRLSGHSLGGSRSSLITQRLEYNILKNVPQAINKSFCYFLNKSIDGSAWNCNLQLKMLRDLLIDIKYIIWLWNTKSISMRLFTFLIRKCVCRRYLSRKIKTFNLRDTYSLIKRNFLDLNILFHNLYLSVPKQ